LFHGEVLDSRDVIAYPGTSVEESELAFRESVEDYLAFCKGCQEKPGKRFSGRLMALALLAPLLLSCLGSDGQTSDRMVDIGSHSLHAVVVGDGAPAVVIDGGIGARCEEYRALQDRISRFTTVVTYDRAGYGSSEVGPLPRDSRREIEELRSLLAELEIPVPHLLVGHSLGGLNAQVYAGAYPEEVAGMVLLDPPPLSFILGEQYEELAAMAERMTAEWQTIADSGLGSENAEEQANAELFQMLASEHREMFDSSARQASGIASFGTIPLVVLASGIPNPMFGAAADSYQAFWAAESNALAGKSARGEYVFAERSTHKLHDDAEDTVVDAVFSMLSSLREPEN
jgi:pimeloyl-ACP methyl ester carboxylesterase